MDRDVSSISISTGTIVRFFVVALFFVALYLVREVALVVLASIIIASALGPFTTKLLRYNIPRVVSVLLLFLLLFVGFFVLFYFFLPPLLTDALNFIELMPEYLGSVEGLDATLYNIFGAQSLLTELSERFSSGDAITDLKETVFSLTGGAIQTLNFVFGGITGFILIVVISFYLSVQERGVENFLRIVTPLQHEKYVLDLWRRSQEKIGLWLQGQVLLGLLIGVLVYLGLTVLGVPYAFLLAVIAALFELIPVFGPVMAAVPAVILGFAEGGATLGLMVIGFYVIIQQFENHLIYPLVVRKVTGVPPLLVIVSLIVGAKLAGFLGIVLAVPIASVLVEFASDIEKRKSMTSTGGAHS
ncbi:MAG: AI-2E family transporter [bacterium]|nr:AI-2E family transporter [bacterium]